MNVQEQSGKLEEQESSIWRRTRERVGRHVGSASLCAWLASLGISIAEHPALNGALIGGGTAVSEALFCGGGILMATAGALGGKVKIGNPFTIRERLPAIAQQAQGSPAFWAGFSANTVGAVGSAGIVIAANALEAQSSALAMGLAAADLVGTAVARVGLYQYVQRHAPAEPPVAVELPVAQLPLPEEL